MSRFIDFYLIGELVDSHGHVNYDDLKKLATVDVVEVVRCKDCTWWKSIFSWNSKEHKVCVRESAEPPRESDDYCSYGERRTE